MEHCMKFLPDVRSRHSAWALCKFLCSMLTLCRCLHYAYPVWMLTLCRCLHFAYPVWIGVDVCDFTQCLIQNKHEWTFICLYLFSFNSRVRRHYWTKSLANRLLCRLGNLRKSSEGVEFNFAEICKLNRQLRALVGTHTWHTNDTLLTHR